MNHSLAERYVERAFFLSAFNALDEMQLDNRNIVSHPRLNVAIFCNPVQLMYQSESKFNFTN